MQEFRSYQPPLLACAISVYSQLQTTRAWKILRTIILAAVEMLYCLTVSCPAGGLKIRFLYITSSGPLLNILVPLSTHRYGKILISETVAFQSRC